MDDNSTRSSKYLKKEDEGEVVINAAQELIFIVSTIILYPGEPSHPWGQPRSLRKWFVEDFFTLKLYMMNMSFRGMLTD